MSDKSLGIIMATAIAAPVMIICCGGGAALIGSAVAGSIGFSRIRMTVVTLTVLGLGIVAVTLSAILWSIVRPDRRIWPPRRCVALTPVVVWVPTIALFGIIIALGVVGWSEFSIPNWLRQPPLSDPVHGKHAVHDFLLDTHFKQASVQQRDVFGKMGGDHQRI